MTDTPTTERAQATASTAADEGKHVAGVAQGEAAKVATEAKDQARSLAGEAKTQVTTQVSDQSRQQRDKLVSTLSSLGDDLGKMADQSEGGLAADVAREVAAHARSLTSYLDSREPVDLLDDVRDFARRRPGLFLVGALTAGVVAGRMARGVKDANSPSSGRTTSYGSTQPAPMYSAPPASGPAYGTEPVPVTPSTTTAMPAYDDDPAYDPLAPATPPPSTPPNYSQGTL